MWGITARLPSASIPRRGARPRPPAPDPELRPHLPRGSPSLVPKKAGDWAKISRPDAGGLARLLRAGELTAVWVPDARHEAIRELTRARDAALTFDALCWADITLLLARSRRTDPARACLQTECPTKAREMGFPV